MPTIIVQGRPVRVSDSFFELSPEEQSTTVREIAEQMAREADAAQPSVNSFAKADRSDPAAMAPAWRDGFGLPSPNEASSSERKSDRDLSHSEPSWSDVPKNVVPSAINTAAGLWDMVTHPQRTAETIVDAAQGGVDRIMPEEFTNFMDTYVSPRSAATRERQRLVSGAVGEALKNRYWGLDNIKRTMITDPVGSGLDILGIAGGGYGLVRGGLSVAPKARFAEIPNAALNAERLAAKELGQAIAKNNIGQVPSSKSNTIKRIANDSGSLSPEIPGQTFLTKGLEKKRHNYPPSQTIADDIGTSLDDMPMKPRNKLPTVPLHHPPTTPQRPFEADYPKTPAHDETGKLLVDVDGDPIIAQHVAGRQSLGGKDVGFNPKKFWEVAKKLTEVEIVPRKDLGNALGKMLPGSGPTDVRAIRLAKELPQRHMDFALAHELGHALHKKAGLPPITDPVMRAELERNYSRLRTGIENPEKLKLPRDVHGSYGNPVKSDRELVAYGYHAAFADPNYAKKMLPVSYATLRQWIKSNPELARLIINNSVAAATVAATLAAAGERNEAKAKGSPPRTPQRNLSGSRGSRPGTSIPFGLLGEATRASTEGSTELAKALSRRGLYPKAPKNEKFRELVQALVDLKAGQESQSYGGPR